MKQLGRKNGLIVAINQKLNGWASYYRSCEAKDAFKHIDLAVSALLLRYVMQKYPNKSQKQLIRQFWWQASDERYIFALNTNHKVRVISLEDTLLLEPKCLDIRKNAYLDKDYFDSLNDNLDIQNVTGKYKDLWNKQVGKCAICGKKIETYQERTVIQKNLYKKNPTMRDKIYIHQDCQESELIIIKTINQDLDAKKISDYVKEINDVCEKHEKKKPSKFDKLTAYFHNSKKKKITLEFSQIEKIIGSKLCNSAYKHKSYFYNHKDERAIANSWTSQGYKITNCDLEKQKIDFERVNSKKLSNVKVPDFIFKGMPFEAKYELEGYLKEFQEKYKL